MGVWRRGNHARYKTCFVVMGFGEKTDFQSNPQRVLDLNKTFEYIIQPTVEESRPGVHPRRQDHPLDGDRQADVRATARRRPGDRRSLDVERQRHLRARRAPCAASVHDHRHGREQLQVSVRPQPPEHAAPTSTCGKDIGFGEVHAGAGTSCKKKIVELIDKIRKWTARCSCSCRRSPTGYGTRQDVVSGSVGRRRMRRASSRSATESAANDERLHGRHAEAARSSRKASRR